MGRAVGPHADFFSESYLPLGKLTNHRCYHTGQRIHNSQLNTVLLKVKGPLMEVATKSQTYQQSLLPLQLTCLLRGVCVGCLPA